VDKSTDQLAAPTFAYTDATETAVTITWTKPTGAVTTASITGYQIHWLKSDGLYAESTVLCDGQTIYNAATTGSSWSCTSISIDSLRTFTGIAIG